MASDDAAAPGRIVAHSERELARMVQRGVAVDALVMRDLGDTADYEFLVATLPLARTLTTVDLRGAISYDRWDKLAAVLPLLPHLQRVDVADNGRGVDVAAVLPHLPNLTHLAVGGESMMSQCNIDDHDLVALLGALVNCPALRSFELSYSLYTGLTVPRVHQLLASAVASLPHLRKLNLHRNRIGDKGLHALAAAANAAPDFPRLRVLNLRDCGIADAGVTSLCQLLRCQPKLRELQLGMNHISDAGAAALAAALPACRKMRRLKLDDVGFHGCSAAGTSQRTVDALAAAAAQLPRLRELHIARSTRCMRDADPRASEPLRVLAVARLPLLRVLNIDYPSAAAVGTLATAMGSGACCPDLAVSAFVNFTQEWTLRDPRCASDWRVHLLGMLRDTAWVPPLLLHEHDREMVLRTEQSRACALAFVHCWLPARAWASRRAAVVAAWEGIP
jgi:Ran GTPase-activating protein (RanGAP) involved in mRNA processing and transport